MSSGVSVIVPSFESWPVLHRTLEAVVHDCVALDGPWELIIVDNESGESFIRNACRFAEAHDAIRLIRRRGLEGRNFQPGAARNIGVEEAHHDTLVFLDADCVPSTALIAAYREKASAHRDVVFVGHREFVDTTGIDPGAAAADRGVLGRLKPVASTSNYGQTVERRMPELRSLETHPRPYDCMYACNMAMHRECLGDLRFAAVFDGCWGYEDIELGYRLHNSGRRFRYLPEAFVYHQEGGSISPEARAAGRQRNFLIADSMISDFARYRESISRAGAVPGDA